MRVLSLLLSSSLVFGLALAENVDVRDAAAVDDLKMLEDVKAVLEARGLASTIWSAIESAATCAACDVGLFFMTRVGCGRIC
jgi:hypothetical protein